MTTTSFGTPAITPVEAQPTSSLVARLDPWLLGVLSGLACLPIAIALGYYAQKGVASAMGPAEIESLRSANLVLYGGTKSGEYLYPIIALLPPLLCGWFTWRLARHGGVSPTSRVFVVILGGLALLIVLPMLLSGSVAPLAVLPSGPLPMVVLLQTGPVIVWLALSWSWLRGSRTALEIGPASLSIVFGFSSVGLVVALRSLVAPNTVPPLAAFIASSLVLVLGAAAYSRALVRQDGGTPWLLTITSATAGALCLPLLWPPQLVSGGVTQWPPGVDDRAWKAFSLTAVAAMGAHALWRWRLPNHGAEWSTAVSSAALASFLVPLRVVPSLPTVYPDDYHFGELIAPLILWVDHGQAPYLDQDVVRGLLQNYLPQWTNGWLAGGQATTLQYAYPAIAFVFVGMAVAVLRRVMGTAMALFAAGSLALANSYIEADLLAVALLMGLLGLLISQRRPWLVGLTLGCGLIVLIVVYPMGGLAGAVVVGFAITLGLVGAGIGYRTQRWTTPLTVSGAMLLAVGICAVSPLGMLARGAIEYVAANAGSNAKANGVALSFTHSLGLSPSTLLQFAFICAIPLSMFLVSAHRRTNASWSKGLAIAVALTPLVWVVMLLGRYMGRIDAVAWSPRPAWGTLVVLAVVVPGAAMLIPRDEARFLARASVLVAAALSAAVLPVGGGNAVDVNLSGMAAPESWPSTNANAVLPRIGVGEGVQTHLDEQIRLHGQTAAFPPGERVLNLTNRGALFAYHGWSNPVAKLAPYNIESESTELETVKRLALDPPTHALLNVGATREARQEFDGASLTLRNPNLARWVMDNYSPIECDGSIWGISDISAQTPPGSLVCGSSPAESAEARVALWARGVGAPEDLALLPSSWGTGDQRQVASGWREVPVTELGWNDDTQRREFAVDLPADSPGLLRLSMTCEGSSGPGVGSDDVVVEWNRDNQLLAEFSRARFRYEQGAFLVPLDAYAAWSELATAPGDLFISTSHQCSGQWSVRGELGSRK